LFVVEALHSFGKGFICTLEYLRDNSAYGLNLRAALLRAAADDQSGSHGDVESEDPGSFKVSKSRYESFYERQGDGGKLGAIDTTAVDDARCVYVCMCVWGGLHAVEGYLYPICAFVLLISTPISGT
jgi:hypothetical protein